MGSQNRKGKNFKTTDPSKPYRDYEKTITTSKPEIYNSDQKLNLDDVNCIPYQANVIFSEYADTGDLSGNEKRIRVTCVALLPGVSK